MANHLALASRVNRFSRSLREQLTRLVFQPEGARALLSGFPEFSKETLLRLLAAGAPRLEGPTVRSLATELRRFGLREAVGSPGLPELPRSRADDLDGLLPEWLTATYWAEARPASPERDDLRVRRIDTSAWTLSREAHARWPAYVELETRADERGKERVAAVRFAFRLPGFARADDVKDAEEHRELWTSRETVVTPQSPRGERIRALLVARCLLTVRLQIDGHLPGHFIGEHVRNVLRASPQVAESPLGQAILTYVLDADASTDFGGLVIVGPQGVFRRTPIASEDLAVALGAGVQARKTERLGTVPMTGKMGSVLTTLNAENRASIENAMPAILAGTPPELRHAYEDLVNQGSRFVPAGFFGSLHNPDDIQGHLAQLAVYGCTGHTMAHAMQDTLGAPDYGPLALRPGIEVPLAHDPSGEQLERWLADALPDTQDGAMVQLVAGEMLAAPNAHEAQHRVLAPTNPLTDLPRRIVDALQNIESPIRRVSLSAAV